MPTTDERVAQLEVRVEVQTTVMSEVKGLIVALDQKMDRRFDAVEARFDRRLEAVDRRLFSIITIQFATLLAIITAMLGVLTRLL